MNLLFPALEDRAPVRTDSSANAGFTRRVMLVRGAFFVFLGAYLKTRGAFSAEPSAFGLLWCIVRVFMHIAGQLFQIQLFGGSKKKTTLKTVARKMIISALAAAGSR